MKRRSLVKRSISLLAAMILIAVSFTSLPAFSYHGTANITPAVTNLSTKSWVSAQAGTGDAALAIDQDESTYWDAASISEQSWIEIDLGGTYSGMRKVEVVFPSQNGEYKYKLEGSVDGDNWFTLSDHCKKGDYWRGRCSY